MAVRLPRAGRLRPGLLLTAALAALAGCPAGNGNGPDWCADDPAIYAVRAPAVVLPGSSFELTGAGFDESCGPLAVFLRGSFDGRPVEAEAPPDAATTALLSCTAGPGLLGGLGADRGRFSGDIGVRRRDADGRVREAAFPISFDVVPSLAPQAISVSPEAVTLNAVVLVAGDGFLEGDEGVTEVALDGTFAPDAGGTRAVSGMRLPATLAEAHDRTRTGFLFAPTIAGISPGTFTGTLVVHNLHAGGTTLAGDPLPVRFTLGRSFITAVSPSNPSLGGIVAITGAGFIGGASDQTLTLRLDGTATPHDGTPVAVTGLELVPAFVAGGRAEYTLVPERQGEVLVASDFDFSWGSYAGTATPVLRYGAERVDGLPTTLELAIGPTRQVVFVSFLAGFSETLRTFGLRAVETDVRARVLDKFRRTYAGVNVEVRDAPPDDYYVGGYAVVEIGGPDPNGRGLFGYDNTPGKDVGNLRLHDRIGGANAEVQEDGYPGFGGIFVESFLCWSSHRPSGMICPDGVNDPEFDRIFDPLRSREVVAGEYPSGADATRTAQIDAAVRALGSLAGDTAAHEFGHSLGLGLPYGPPDQVHNEPPAEGCLMDAGAYRPFAERAELPGTIPGTWCNDEGGYLQTILPQP